jgi:cell wall-associated NlpC family hydrolase
MLALGFFALMAGGIALVAGIKGSSIHSVVQGKPDSANSQGLGSNPTTGTSLPSSTPTFPTISAGKAKFGSVLQFAKAELGQPYVWGGSEPGGFDCSGLMQYIYDKAGIKLPRTAEAQYNATRHVTPGESLLPGMLVFFREADGVIGHVGLYLGEGKMLDAPHTGANVRVETIPTQIGAAYGADTLAGFTEP